MTGLDLESFLQLNRADLGVWLGVGSFTMLLALMAWTSWGSRRALRKCLGLSIAVHLGLGFYWFTHPSLLLGRETSRIEVAEEDEGIREIRVIPRMRPASAEEDQTSADGRPERRSADWDRPRESLTMADRLPRPERAALPEAVASAGMAERTLPEPVATDLAGPEPPPPPAAPREATEGEAVGSDVAAVTPESVEAVAAPAGVGEVASAAMPSMPGDSRRAVVRPGAAARVEVGAPQRVEEPPLPFGGSPETKSETSGTELVDRGSPELIAPTDLGPPPAHEGEGEPVEPASAQSEAGSRPIASTEGPAVGDVGTPVLARPEADVRQRSRPVPSRGTQAPAPRRPAQDAGGIALADLAPAEVAVVPAPRELLGGRPLAEVPEIYRSRLDPNRSARAQRAGASAESEQAVERALVWLARHQDNDGRWDGKVGKLADGTPIPGDDDYTVHCPTDDPCPGECFYWEADTALTGLALLAYLGAGYTHQEGTHANTVARGLRFLLRVQKPDGDLRGESRSVGMYCHSMASLALCEAYALTGDPQLKGPATRAVGFLVRAQAPDGRGWRYAPQAPLGDTSILGWAVLVLKSAGYGGLAVPTAAEAGASGWLDRVTEGAAGGLAAYQPGKAAKASMTAEAWACRLFLGAGGRGADGDEASAYLMARRPDREAAFNLYYWYYGTLAMYLHGGPDWPKWNVGVRDELVRRQQTRGHQLGSWDPDESPEGNRGGRIYSTALGALTLEVYYRYLRVYGETVPATGPRPGPKPKGPGEVPAGRGWRKAEKGLGAALPIR